MRPFAAAQSIGRSDQRRKNAVPGVLTLIEFVDDIETGSAGPRGRAKKRKDELRKCADNVLLHGDVGNRNAHTVLMVRSCLSSVIEKMNERQDQLQAVYSKLREWGEILFKDGILEKVLKESGLDSE